MTTPQQARRNAYTGGKGFTAHAIEYRPGGSPSTAGTPAAPTSYLPVKKNTLKPKYARVKEKVQSGTRYANRVNQITIATCEGAIDFMLSSRLWLEYAEALLGATSDILAVDPVATIADTTTDNGLSTLSVTGAFIKGAPVHVNVDNSGNPTFNTEVSQVESYSAGTLVVRGLKKNATAATGIKVTQPAMTKIANSLLPSGYENELPLLTLEKNKGGKYAYQFPSVFGEKLDIAFTGTTVDASMGLYGTQLPNLFNATGTPLGDEPVVGVFHDYNPSSQDEAIALAPYTSINAAFMVPGDPYATGTAGIGGALAMTDGKISFDNKLIKKTILGSDVMECWPGDEVELNVEWNEVDTAGWPVIFENYIKVNGGVPLYFCLTKNLGSLMAPEFHTLAGFIPFAMLEDSDGDDTPGDLGKYDQKAFGMVQRGAAQDLLQLFVVS